MLFLPRPQGTRCRLTAKGRPQLRWIERIGVRTPLLVPSFSSRGFSSIGAIFNDLRLHLFGSCLVSAFDHASGRIVGDFSDFADLVVLDSGVYETDALLADEGGRTSPPSRGSPWTRDAYRALLTGLRPNANVVAVSFDGYEDTAAQIRNAVEDFACAPSAVGDLLLKPETRGQALDPLIVRRHAEQLATQSVIGVTERELGDTIRARCVTLASIRDALSEIGSRVPIHVFGVITPGTVLAYFLSGADIFDGLNWLRFDYQRPHLGSMAESCLEDEAAWDLSDAAVLADRWRANLRVLQRFQEALRVEATNHDLNSLREILPSSLVDAASRLAAPCAR